jgi:hypothetical protein
MMMQPNYRANFEIIMRGNGTALVTCKYDRILGDRWFAIIDAATVPAPNGKDEDEEDPEDDDEDATPRIGPRGAELESDILDMIQTMDQYIPFPESKPGKYVGLSPQLFVDSWVMLGLETGVREEPIEHLWVQCTGEFNGTGDDELVGNLDAESQVSTNYVYGEQLGFKVSEIEDVITRNGAPSKTAAHICDTVSEHSDLFRVACNRHMSKQDATELWFSLSDLEKTHILAVYKKLRPVPDQPIGPPPPPYYKGT